MSDREKTVSHRAYVAHGRAHSLVSKIYQFEIVITTPDPDSLESELLEAGADDVHIQKSADGNDFTLTYYRRANEFSRALSSALAELGNETMATVKSIHGPLRASKTPNPGLEERG